MTYQCDRSIFSNRFLSISLSTSGLVGLVFATDIHAQPPLPAGTVATTGDAAFMYQFATEMDDGGDVSVSSAELRLDQNYSFDAGNSIGWGLEYQADFYSFAGDSDLGSVDPWDTINTLALSGTYGMPLGDDWSFRVAPSIIASRESCASVSDFLSYWAIFVFTRRYSATLTLGLRAGAFTGLKETTGFPVIAVRWAFAPGCPLQNPLHPGPAVFASQMMLQFRKGLVSTPASRYSSVPVVPLRRTSSSTFSAECFWVDPSS